MKRFLCLILVVMAVCSMLLADDYDYGLSQEGYYDLPYMPGTAWKIQTFDRPRPPVVEPKYDGKPVPAPSGVKVLFDGTEECMKKNWQNDRWKLQDDFMYAPKDAGEQASREEFGDAHIHIEFATPMEPDLEKKHGQGRGNSGVFVMGTYEVQVLDSYNNETYADGQCGSLYAMTPPIVNACKPPEQWQSYDIYFKAPQWKDGKLLSPPWISVIHNGHIIQNNTMIIGHSSFRVVTSNTPRNSKGQLKLQYHGHPVRYRNIWVEDLSEKVESSLGWEAWDRSGKPVRDAYTSVTGWTDTPQIPGTPWKVCGSERPLPPCMLGIYDQKPVRAPGGAKMLLSTDPATLDNWNNDNWKKTYERGVVRKVDGNFTTKESFGDARFHVEFKTQFPVPGLGNDVRSNSGIFVMDSFEVQILDSYQNPSFADGQCAAIYAQTPARYNVSGMPGEWQCMDILFRAPEVADGKVTVPAYITVFHNNVLVHDNVKILGPVQHRNLAKWDGFNKTEGPLTLQAHPGEVFFRNVWTMPLTENEKKELGPRK